MSPDENPRKSGKSKTWRKTRKQGLYQHRNGSFFSRRFHGGKETWTPLNTTTLSVAEQKHAELRRKLKQTRQVAKEGDSGNLTFGQALERFKADRLDNSIRKKPLKPSTIRYQDELFTVISRDWPDVMETPLKRIKPSDCREWANRAGEQVGATRFNGALGIIRAVFKIGVEQGAIADDPSAVIESKTVPKTIRDLPTKESFNAVVAKIRSTKARFSKACADFVEGLARTGIRKGEAGRLKWRDINLEREEMTLRDTKNGRETTVPLLPQAAELFTKMKAVQPNTAPNDRVFLVREAQKALDRATKLVGCPRLTHHSLRSLFATYCLEAGIDVPTVAGWLNHSDGGALLMKTYNQIRMEHSKSAASKVRF